MRGIAYLAGAVLLALTLPASATLPSRPQIDRWMTKLGADNQFNPDKTIDWGILPGPFYTPEMGLGIGAAAVGMYRLNNTDSVNQNSTLTFTGFLSSTGAFGIDVENYSFFADDQWRFFLNGTLNNVPTYYWGKGYQAGKNDNNKEQYTSQELALRPRILYRLADALYVGVGWDLSAIHVSNYQRGNQSPLRQEQDGSSVLSSGLGLTLSYDTRDVVSNATRGHIFNLTTTHFDPHLGSNNRFNSMETQYALYYSLSEKNVLALESYGRFTQGDTPWAKLSELGNGNRMRGYYRGRYRDHHIISSQLEYRRKLDWRHGFVTWVGGGSMGHNISDLGKYWLPNIGVGYRFEFKPRMNVRLDFGVGQQSTGFYFQVGEAF